jgi:alanyl-tRNA synthetase
MLTERLFYKDSYISTFNATVKGCVKNSDFYHIILDKTAFFFEGGGQKADTGFIGEAVVSDVREIDGQIVHICDRALEIDKEYICSLNWDVRFRRMQQHGGEHIVSGIVHSLFGYDNVGFHMEDDYVTVDFNGELTREQLDEVEDKANLAVCKNYDIVCYFPNEKQLAELDYRSKLDLTEGVRLVDIKNTDLCACCAPHLSKTGEIGAIKILDFMRHRGGVRLVMKSGLDAVEDYRNKYKSVYEISNFLSAKQGEVTAAVERLKAENESLYREFTAFKATVANDSKKSMIFTSKCAYLIVSNFDADMMREVANFGMEMRELCLVFSGNDEAGYSYIACSKTLDMRSVAKDLNNALQGRGGGRDTMIQGKVAATEEVIKKYINSIEN